MTLRELGEKSGFENRGDVRIAQYENGSRVPKTGKMRFLYQSDEKGAYPGG